MQSSELKLCGIIASLVLFAFAVLGPANSLADPGDTQFSSSSVGIGPTPNLPDQKWRAEELERQVTAVYQQVSPAVVQCMGWNQAGVIVSADGDVLIRAITQDKKLSFQLPDGRRVTGVARGWSEEYDLGLAKLDGPGPWPHVKFDSAGSVRAGQCVLTLGCGSLGLVRGPLLHVDWVTGVAPGVWFMTSDVPTLPNFVFDLSGNLIGATWVHWWGERAVYTEAKLLQGLWNDLIAGKNRDQVRLRRLEIGKAGKESDEKSAIQQPAMEKATRATVRIRREPADRGFSGVVITAEGLVATCAHHFVMPGNRVIICSPDGRDAAGKVVGINLLCDIGLVQITDPGPWPHAEMGNSVRLRPGDPCLAIGYGPVQSRERQPSVRKSKVVAPGTGHWEYRLSTDPSTPFVGGDSGGGIFDVQGRLVAIHTTQGRVNPNGVSLPHKHPRVELFREHWDELRAAFEQSAASPLTAAQADLNKATAAGRRSIAEVLDGKNTVALATIISRDGRLLTKASNLPKSPSCRLFDGRVVPAKAVKISREHDLAVLKIQASDLPLAEWSSVESPGIGTLVAIAGAGNSLSPAFVSHTTISIPPERGVIWTGLSDSAKGLEVVEVGKELNPPVLRKGDIILSIDGQATPDRKAYVNLIDPKDGKPLAIAGDQLRLLVKRDGKEVEVLLPLGPPTLPRPEGQSPRYSGFARVFGVLIDTKFPLGGPVLDPNGHIAGVAIAWQARGWLLVLPATTARTVISE